MGQVLSLVELCHVLEQGHLGLASLTLHPLDAMALQRACIGADVSLARLSIETSLLVSRGMVIVETYRLPDLRTAIEVMRRLVPAP
jgi:hypothetical protein